MTCLFVLADKLESNLHFLKGKSPLYCLLVPAYLTNDIYHSKYIIQKFSARFKYINIFRFCMSLALYLFAYTKLWWLFAYTKLWLGQATVVTFLEHLKSSISWAITDHLTLSYPPLIGCAAKTYSKNLLKKKLSQHFRTTMCLKMTWLVTWLWLLPWTEAFLYFILLRLQT